MNSECARDLARSVLHLLPTEQAERQFLGFGVPRSSLHSAALARLVARNS